MSYIETYSGQKFRFDPFDPEAIEIVDIVHALSNLCRFAGHVPKFYSVAEHTYHVVSLLPQHLKLFGFLHDATEAYMCDITKPFKSLLPDYQSFESRLHKVIYEKFIGRVPNEREAPTLHWADMAALKREAYAMIPSRGVGWFCLEGVELVDFDVENWDPVTGEQKLLEVWVDLWYGRGGGGV